jgi:hypothetical protein
MKRMTMILAMATLFIVSVRGQDFTNLDLESAYNLPGNPVNGVFVSVTNALPGWTAYDGDAALSDIYYVSNYLGGFASAVELAGGSNALSGNNLSVELSPDGSISQTGLVPDNAESLQFEALIAANGLSVKLGGQSLSYSAISEGPDYNVYGANIPTDMDGEMEALTFSIQPGPGDVLLDDIEFSPIPEPSEYALIGLGAILFGFYRRKAFAVA